ncbi:hypothetical protein HYALB_00012372 [Hymenoscyphus albidus]|uniref:rRNA adenine N(6)-methyltransferase n=1 Tax=Hymenoscyphus albidus TaxID=595503 RepID=A0A9N9QA50_9HELO|nr:hypothetical protein HYALB_00012372 [Hymenoscyphus albidus]
MLRIVLTAARPVFRSSLARPYSVVQHPHKHSPFLRSFHTRESLRYPRAKPKVDPEPNPNPDPVVVANPTLEKSAEADNTKLLEDLDKAPAVKVAKKLRRRAKKIPVPDPVVDNSTLEKGAEANNTQPLEDLEETPIVKGKKKTSGRVQKNPVKGAEANDTNPLEDSEDTPIAKIEKKARRRVQKKPVPDPVLVDNSTLEKGSEADDTKSLEDLEETPAVKVKKKTRRRVQKTPEIPSEVEVKKSRRKKEKNPDIVPNSNVESKALEEAKTDAEVSPDRSSLEPSQHEYAASRTFLESLGISMPQKHMKAFLTPGSVHTRGRKKRPNKRELKKELKKQKKQSGVDGDQTESAPVEDIPTKKIRPKAICNDFEMELSGASVELAEGLAQVMEGVSKSSRKRVNVVSGELCDDILERLKPSLSKHIGCDILDLNPGACVWSSKMHEFLKPRTHVLMENDAQIYKPYIQPLLDAPGSTYKLCVKSPLIWSEMNSVFTKDFFPLQEAFPEGDPRLDEPNDTMLVLVNLAFFPKQSYKGFPSITPLVIHQLISSVMSHALFQKYGLIRMLVWVADTERESMLPRHVTFRRKASLEAEIACKITEVASSGSPPAFFRRDSGVEISITRKVLEKMKQLDIKTPRGRESIVQEHIMNYPDDAEELVDMLDSDKKTHHYLQELTELEAKWESGDKIKAFRVTEEGKLAHEAKSRLVPNPDYARMILLQNRKEFRTAQKQNRDAIISKHRDLLQQQAAWYGIEGKEASLRRDELKKLRDDLIDEIENLRSREARVRVYTDIDNARCMYVGDSPLLQYDRRVSEPLKAYKEEFYPSQTELCLLDFEPQPIWPVLRKNFPANLDIFQHILTTIFALPSQSVKQALISLWPGAYEYLVQECPSLTDPTVGGDPNLDLLAVRCLPFVSFREILEAWDRWPFRPTREDLLAHGGMWENDEGLEAISGMTMYP